MHSETALEVSQVETKADEDLVKRKADEQDEIGSTEEAYASNMPIAGDFILFANS